MRRWWIPLFVSGVVVGAILLTYGWTYFEKVATELILPCGLIWLALAAITKYAWQKHRLLGLACLTCWLLYSVAGNTVVGDWLLGTLEHRYASRQPLAEDPFDVIVVLGGGAAIGVNGSPQLLGESGNRIMLAGRLYHAGKAKHVLCAGSGIEGISLGADSDPAVLTAKLLKDIGVPDRSISLVGGHNTKSEIAEVAQWCRENNMARIGIVTSAWHMPRAERLARQAQLNAVPLPAHFATAPPDFTLICLIPNANGFRVSPVLG